MGASGTSQPVVVERSRVVHRSNGIEDHLYDRAVSLATWLQLENGAAQAVRYHTLTEYGRGVAASTISFRPTGGRIETKDRIESRNVANDKIESRIKYYYKERVLGAENERYRHRGQNWDRSRERANCRDVDFTMKR
ncbi:hypothetical protein EVAR_15991_1 [Eumeta japonica]|uniref:Uncharacterized protein n=1 Tax=Eumeta variegata TaxID=151549 RepID=A0A4C1UL82_EUMVA|nr:hypothetical protein EVAR_15991_1 [Eumeta japonica]